MVLPKVFHLESNKFGKKFNQNINNLRNDTDFTDVTLVSEDNQQIQSHKIILATSSPFFQDMLKQNKHPHPIIIMKGTKTKDIISILDFLYYGEVKISQHDLSDFLKAAEGLQIPGLQDEDEENEPKKVAQERAEQIQERSETVEHEEFSTVFLDDAQQQTLIGEDQAQCKVEIESHGEHPSSLPQVEINNDFKVQLFSMMEKVYGGWRCVVCYKDELNLVLRKDDMEKHVETKHLDMQLQVMWTCETCNKTHKTKSGLTKHVYKHHKKEHLDSTSKNITKGHTETHDRKKDKMQITSIDFTGLEGLSDYTKITHFMDEKIDPMIEKYGLKQWICKICGKISNYKTNIKCHVEANHLERGSYPCPECSKNIQSRNGLWTHISRFHRQYLLDNVMSRKLNRNKLV